MKVEIGTKVMLKETGTVGLLAKATAIPLKKGEQIEIWGMDLYDVYLPNYTKTTVLGSELEVINRKKLDTALRSRGMTDYEIREWLKESYEQIVSSQ